MCIWLGTRLLHSFFYSITFAVRTFVYRCVQKKKERMTICTVRACVGFVCDVCYRKKNERSKIYHGRLEFVDEIV